MTNKKIIAVALVFVLFMMNTSAEDWDFRDDFREDKEYSYSISDVNLHSNEGSCWIVYNNMVLDVTYLKNKDVVCGENNTQNFEFTNNMKHYVIGRIEEESNKQEKYASSEGGFKYKADNKTQEDKIGEDMPDTENKTNTDKIEHKIQDNSDDMNHIIKNETVNRSVVSDKGVITVENITEQVYGNLIDNTETKWVYSNEPIWMKVMRWLNLI